MDPHIIILGAASIVIVSFLFGQVSKQTHIPSVLMLMLLGFGLKFILPIKDTALMPALELLGTLGVILIVLEAALDLHLEKDKLKLMGKAALMAFMLLVVTAALIAISFKFILGLSVLVSLFYAVPLAVLSSAIIIPSVNGLKEYSKEFLIFESALSDILGIIIFYSLIDYHHADPGANVGLGLTIKTLLTIGLSFVISYALILIFQYGRGHATLFVLIASLLALYATGKLLHLSSLIIILVFGLVLNNRQIFFQGPIKKYLNETDIDGVLKEFKSITLETAFVVRTFFFVAFGLSIVPSQLLDWTVPLITMIILAAIYITRYMGLRVVHFRRVEPEIYVAPRGLITILLFYAIPEDVMTDAFPPGILLLTVLITNFVMTYGLIKERKRIKAEKKLENILQSTVSGQKTTVATQQSVETTVGPGPAVLGTEGGE